MSKLRIYDRNSQDYLLNVTQFRSPMSASINSVQTRKMLQHFPIRCGQPDISFTVQFANLDDKHDFEAFVRKHQLESQDQKDNEVTLWWPERGIENWSGYITKLNVSVRRFEIAPTITFGVSLIKSLMSDKAEMGSPGINLFKILGLQIPDYRGYRDLLIIRPSFSNTATVNPDDRVGGEPTYTPPPNTGPTPPAAVRPGGGGGSF